MPEAPPPAFMGIARSSAWRQGSMEIRNPVCCGLDVHKRMLVACLRRVAADGTVTKDLREFATTVDALLAL
jgi:hypothetical protein